MAQPSGWSPETPTLFYDNNMQGWGPDLVQRRPEITMDQVDAFLTKMYLDNQDFVFTVTRDFVRQCQTPILILPDDIPAHPYEVAMEAAMLARETSPGPDVDGEGQAAAAAWPPRFRWEPKGSGWAPVLSPPRKPMPTVSTNTVLKKSTTRTPLLPVVIRANPCG